MKSRSERLIIGFLLLYFALAVIPFLIEDTEWRYIFGGLSKLSMAACLLVVILRFVREKRAFDLPPFNVSRDERPVLFWLIMGFFMFLFVTAILISLIFFLPISASSSN